MQKIKCVYGSNIDDLYYFPVKESKFYKDFSPAARTFLKNHICLIEEIEFYVTRVSCRSCLCYSLTLVTCWSDRVICDCVPFYYLNMVLEDLQAVELYTQNRIFDLKTYDD